MSTLSVRIAASLALLLALPACTATIGRQNPHPNVSILPQAKSLRLAFGSGVADQFAFPVAHCTVDDWHATLTEGFHKAFAVAFRSPSGADADLVLTLDDVRLEIGDYKPAHARIQYKATISGRGAVLRHAEGTAMKPFGGSAGTATGVLSGDVDGAVEALYEHIAKDLASIVEPQSLVKTCVPGQPSPCVGPKGCQGAQICAEDGSRYGACSCGG